MSGRWSGNARGKFLRSDRASGISDMRGHAAIVPGTLSAVVIRIIVPLSSAPACGRWAGQMR
jgi:hypothetical protein